MSIAMDAPVRRTPSRANSRQFRLILAVTYLGFLAVVIAQRLMPRRADARTAMRARRSIFGEAKALADRTIPFAFMG